MVLEAAQPWGLRVTLRHHTKVLVPNPTRDGVSRQQGVH